MTDAETAIRRYIARCFDGSAMPFTEFLDEVMETLHPLCDIATTGIYPLMPAERVDHDRVTAAIVKATGRTVDRVVVASGSCPFPQPDWMSAAVHHDHRRMMFWDELFASVRRTVAEDVALPLVGRYGVDYVANVRNTVNANLGEPLGVAVIRALGWGRDLGDAMLKRRISQLGIVQGGIIMPYVTAATLGDTAALEQLYPLVLLLSEILPIGERKDAPGVWIVLAA